MAKQQIWSYPKGKIPLTNREWTWHFFGDFMDSINQIPVDRSKGMRAYAVAEDVLEQGGTTIIYPEGTKTDQLNNRELWPIPTTVEGYAARKAGKHVERLDEERERARQTGIDGRYKRGAAALSINTDSLILPVLTYVTPLRAKIRFGQALDPSSEEMKGLPRQERRNQLTIQSMLQIAEMMAEAKGKELPDEVREKIVNG
jgi:1-acyl-sn-glycerol-3-phosphate acyltransferase